MIRVMLGPGPDDWQVERAKESFTEAPFAFVKLSPHQQHKSYLSWMQTTTQHIFSFIHLLIIHIDRKKRLKLFTNLAYFSVVRRSEIHSWNDDRPTTRRLTRLTHSKLHRFFANWTASSKLCAIFRSDREIIRESKEREAASDVIIER